MKTNYVPNKLKTSGGISYPLNFWQIFLTISFKLDFSHMWQYHSKVSINLKLSELSRMVLFLSSAFDNAFNFPFSKCVNPVATRV